MLAPRSGRASRAAAAAPPSPRSTVRGLTIEDVIPALLDLKARYHCTFYADPSEPAYIEQCRRAGLAMVKANNDVLPGITAVTAALAAGMTVSPGCTGLLAEVPAYVWKQERGSGEMADSPMKSNDDACDAWRYANIALSIDTEPGLVLYYRSETARLRAAAAGT